MEGAEGETVALLVRTAGLVPLDMSGFQTDGGVSQSYIETADNTPIFVSSQYSLPEAGVPGSAVFR